MTRRRPVILLDVDGVIANFIDGALPIAERLTRQKHHHDDIDQWHMEKALGLTEDQTHAFYAEIASEGHCIKLPVYEGAIDGVKALREIADVHPVTAPFASTYWVGERETWLLNHFGFHHHDVVHTNAKHLIRGDILIEDKPETIVKWCQHHPTGRGILIARNYNKYGLPATAHPLRYSRARDWSDIVHTCKIFLEDLRAEAE